MKDNSHRTEFIVTTTYINKYLKNHDHVLDIGAGSGIYSIFCARKRAKVVALDLSKKNLDLLEERILSTDIEDRISIHEGNGKDLSKFDDQSFDIILNMGPLYHLKSLEDKKLTISESLRVLKPRGMLFIAYINKYFKFYQRITKGDQPIKWEVLENIVKYGWKFDNDEAVFFFLFPSEAETLFSDHTGRILYHVGTDGISPFIADSINEMTPKDYSKWMEFQLQFCQDPHLLGISLHNLIVFQKE